MGKIVFYSEKDCIETITDFRQQDNYMLQGLHNIPKAISSFDKVKKSFATCMISSTAAHRVLTSLPISESVKQNDTNRIFNHRGWALPVRLSFRFRQD